MWKSAAVLEAARVLDTTLQLLGRAGTELVAGIDWQALAAALGQAEALSIRWPLIRRQQRVIALTSSPRGREDEPVTVQALEAGRLAATGQPLRIEQAVYRETRTEPWRSGSLAADLGRLIRRVEEITEDDAAHRAITPLRTARALAAPPLIRGARRELPLSSWPPAAARLAWIVRRAVAQIGKVGSAADRHAPVRRLWQLYQDWVAVEVLTRLSELLGEPAHVSGRLLGAWAWRDVRVELWSQPLFAYVSPRTLCGQKWVSVGYGALQPDLVLAVRVGAAVRVCALDAKAYRRLDQPSTVDEQLAKYLWGLRPIAARGPRVHVLRDDRLARAVLVSPLPAVLANAPGLHRRMRMVHAAPPPDGQGVSRTAILNVLAFLGLPAATPTLAP